MNIQDDGSALILHFATAIAVQRMGVGTCLARTLATILKQKYGVSRIVFCERHPRDHDAAFFRSLGATPSRGHNNSSHGWHWEL